MGGVASTQNSKPQSPVPAGKIRICVSGYWYSPPTGRAHKVANHLATTYPDKFESWYYWGESNGAYYRFLLDTFDKIPFPTELKGHASSPFVWLEVNKGEATGASADPCNAIVGSDNAVLQIIGGNDRFQQWVKEHTSKADDATSPVAAPAKAALSEAEIAAKVAMSPAGALYFKDTPELSECYSTWKFSDISHVEKFGPATAADKQ